MANGDIGIGKLIEKDRHRDAIHIAVAPVSAGEILRPGDTVRLVGGLAMRAYENPIGIVDPFLITEWTEIQKGDKFYLFLMPGSVTSLRHEWEHPSFDKVPVKATKSSKAASEAWLREYAKLVNPYYAEGGYYWKKTGKDEAYELLMRDIREGNNITYHGIDMHSLGDLRDPDELKHHAEVVLGRQVDWGTFEYFGCSC